MHVSKSLFEEEKPENPNSQSTQLSTQEFKGKIKTSDQSID